MPPAERRAFLLLLLLAILGQGVRYLLTKPGEAPGQIQILADLLPGSPLAQRDSAMRQGRPLARGERVDVDAANAAEIARLPKVGPRLAKTILADREANGPFGSLEGLDRVAGVGPGLLKLMEPHVVFSSAVVSARETWPDSGMAAPLTRSPAAPLNLNTATAAELDALPGVGPAKAAAILRYRQERGPFTAVEQLGQVPGFGSAAVSQLRERIVLR
jgi:competence ComEA-like helix-hairpin-helix protein